MRQILILCAAATAVTATLLAAPAAAHAGIDLGATPPDGTVIQPKQAYPITWSATCPAGAQCGRPYSNNSGIASGLTLAFKHDTLTDKLYGIHGESEWSASATGTQSYQPRDGFTAGNWTFTASWTECSIPGNMGSCTVAAATRRFTVPLRYNTDRPKAKVKVGYNYYGKIATAQYYTDCNVPGSVFRANMQLLKRVKVGKKFKWKVALRRNNVKAAASGAGGTSCRWDFAYKWPKGVSKSTKLRVKLVARTKGFEPAFTARPVQSKLFTRGALERAATPKPGKPGGGVVIIG